MPGDNGNTVIEPEVLPPIRANNLNFDMRSMVQSPFFWFVLGAGSASLAIWLIHREGRKRQ